MSAHTPGPWVWEIVGNSDVSGCGTDVCEIVTKDGHQRIAEYVTEADARLIAAAPEMLAIVERTAAHFQDTDAPLGVDARAIIERIKGAA